LLSLPILQLEKKVLKVAVNGSNTPQNDHFFRPGFILLVENDIFGKNPQNQVA
jgi:hypothetical protein